MRRLAKFGESLTVVVGVWLAMHSSDARAEALTNIDAELSAIGRAVLSSLPKGSYLLATCGPSEGKGYYLSPRNDGWVDESITAGRMIFVASPEGTPNILFQDARGGFINAVEDGASISFSFLNPEKHSFGVIETYPKTGVTETFAISLDAEGKRVMLWTSVKAHVSVADITKVTAYRSNCI